MLQPDLHILASRRIGTKRCFSEHNAGWTLVMEKGTKKKLSKESFVGNLKRSAVFFFLTFNVEHSSSPLFGRFPRARGCKSTPHSSVSAASRLSPCAKDGYFSRQNPLSCLEPQGVYDSVSEALELSSASRVAGSRRFG